MEEGNGQGGSKEEIQVSLLVSWCFEPSQPLGIISGLKEIKEKEEYVEVEEQNN